jgi:hypothetical protein
MWRHNQVTRDHSRNEAAIEIGRHHAASRVFASLSQVAKAWARAARLSTAESRSRGKMEQIGDLIVHRRKFRRLLW